MTKRVENCEVDDINTKQIPDYEYLVFIICGASVWGMNFFNESSFIYIKRGAICFLLAGIIHLTCVNFLTEVLYKVDSSRWAWPFAIKMTPKRVQIIGVICIVGALYKFVFQ